MLSIFNSGQRFFFSNYAALNSQITPPELQFASIFRQSFEGPGTSGATTRPANREYAFFVQDDWRAQKNLTLNLGFRYDYQMIQKSRIHNSDPELLAAGFDTSFAPHDKNNFAPRFGASYAFNERTVVRSGFGIFFGHTPAMMTSAVHSQNGIQIVSINLNCISVPSACPIYPATFHIVPANVRAARPDLYIYDLKYQQPFTNQANVQFEREILPHTIFSVLYAVYLGSDLTRARDVNLSEPVATRVPVYNGSMPTGDSFIFQRFSDARPFTNYGRIYRFESTARSFYQGLAFELDSRVSAKWQFNTSYTLSKAKDDRPDQASVLTDGGDRVAENSFDLSREYARSDQDLRHRFIFSSIFASGLMRLDNTLARTLLSNLTIAGIFTAQSGLSYSALVAGDPNNDGNNATDRVPETFRNQFSTKPRYIVDLRVARTIHFSERLELTIQAEAFNLLNRSNVLTVNNTLYTFRVADAGLPARLVGPSSLFGTTRSFLAASQAINLTSSSANREIQLGLRFDF